jgi:hypothetical protein
MDWQKKVGHKISVVLADGSRIKGKLQNVTYDVWKPKRKPQETLNVDMGIQTAHFRSETVAKIKEVV